MMLFSTATMLVFLITFATGIAQNPKHEIAIDKTIENGSVVPLLIGQE